MPKLRDLLRRLRGLLTCFRRMVVMINDVLEDVEEAVGSETSQNPIVDLRGV